MIAVVLVGGEGTRLRPLTATTPKQMLPVIGVTMIERVLSHLGDHGITDAVLSMGYRPEPFYRIFPDDRFGPISISYAVDPEPLDTAGAVRYAAESAGIDETFLAANGDVLTDLDIGELVSFHRSRGAEGTIHLHRVDDPSAFGLVLAGTDGRVGRFVEKPPPGEAPDNTINGGTYVLEPSVLGRIATDRRVSIEREVFPAMVADKGLFALATECYWLDTGTPDKYMQSHFDLLSGLRPGVPAPGATDRGDRIWTMADAIINGVVTGPSFVGEAAVVQSAAIVQGSVLGARARVHTGARVTRSVLLAGAVVRPGATVEDSIIGEGAVVGEEARVSALSVIGDGEQIEARSRLEAARVPAPAAAATP